MGWSLKLGEVAGIRVQVHFTFLIFMAWIVLSGADRRQESTGRAGQCRLYDGAIRLRRLA